MRFITLGGLQWKVLLKQQEDGDWGAFVPTLGVDLFRAYGDTPEEAYIFLTESGPLAFEWLENSGIDIPAPTWDDVTPNFQTEPEPEPLGLHGIFGSGCYGTERIQSTPGANTNFQRRASKRVLHDISASLFAATC